MDINKLLELAGVTPSEKTKLDENCAGGFAGVMGGQAQDIEETDAESHTQEIEYDETMAEAECQTPYDDGHGQYGDKCLVGDSAESAVPVPDQVSGGEEIIVVDLGENDFEDGGVDDTELELDFTQSGEEPEISMVQSIPNVGEVPTDHTVDPSMMVQKIDTMQQGGMSSDVDSHDIEELMGMALDSITAVYNKVMGNEQPAPIEAPAPEQEPAPVAAPAPEEPAPVPAPAQGVENELDENPLAAAAAGAVAGKVADKFMGEDEFSDEFDDDFSGDEFGQEDEPDLGYGDDEVEMDADFGSMDPTNDMAPARTMDHNVQDSSSMVAKIMAMQDSGMSSAKAQYNADSLVNMSPDMLLRVHNKVMGQGLEEEDDNWGGESGYQTQPDDTEGHLRGTSPYNGGEGFPTGQASNAASHIGNTGGDFKDNPLGNSDPVTQVEESTDDIHNRLSEAFDSFCEDYESMIEAELNEIGGMRIAGGPSSMRSRGYGLGSKKSGGKVERRRSEEPVKKERRNKPEVDEAGCEASVQKMKGDMSPTKANFRAATGHDDYEGMEEGGNFTKRNEAPRKPRG